MSDVFGRYVVTACVLLAACDNMARLWSSEVSGDVFIRTGDGQTKPQGGIEVRLLAPEIKQEQAALEARFRERVEQRAHLKADLTTEKDALRQEIERWWQEQISKLSLTIRSAVRRDWRLQLQFGVKNDSDVMEVTYLDFRIFCGKRLMKDYSIIAMKDMAGVRDHTYLKPGEGGIIPDEEISSDLKSTCPKNKFRVTITDFATSVTDHLQPGSVQLEAARMEEATTHDEAARQRKAKIHNLEGQLNAIGAAGVSDLESTQQAAIAKHTRYTTRTAINGHYEFKGVPPGPYFVSAFYKSAIDDTGWFVDVDAKGKTMQDLSNFNFSDPRFGERWELATPATSAIDAPPRR